MRLKQCIFALMAMLLCAFSANAQVTTEAELKAALTTGGNVTLGADIEVTEMIVVPTGVTATLDLNGHAITVPAATDRHIYAINNQGVLTIMDGDGAGSISARGIYNGYDGSNTENTVAGAKLTIEGGNFYGIDANGGAAIFNCAEAIIYGGVFDGKVAALNARAKAKTTVNGGTFRSVSNYAIQQNGGGELTINNATVDRGFGAVGAFGGKVTIVNGEYLPTGMKETTCHVVYVAASATVDIQGGTFKMNYPADSVPDSGSAVASYYNGTLTISGGSFTAHFNNVSPVELSAGSEITGGSYYNHAGEASTHSYVTNFVKDGYELGVDGSIEATFVAKIGSTTYATFAEALTAASAMSGDVTIEVYDKVTLNTAFSGSYSSINFVGKDTDAEIYLDVQGYITATGKKVSFTDLTLSKSAGAYITNAGFMNVAFGIYDVAEVTYTNCVFANGAYAGSGKVTYNGCTFYRSYDKYGLWAYGNVDVAVEGCTFADYRGIKMYAEGAAKTVDLTVKDTDFSAVTDKPAIVLTYGESVVLEGNTYSSTGTFELDLDGAPNGTAVTSDVAPTCKNDNGTCGVLVDGKIYTTAAQAAAVATEGSNVTLLYSTTDTVEFAEGVNLTLANGVTADNVTVATSGVAQVGDTTYATLAEAVAAVEDGGTITMIANETFTENNRYNNGGWWDGLGYSGDKSFTIDLNNFTISQDGALNDYLMWFKNDGAKDNTITLKNGTLDAGTTAYCALATASSNAKKITVNLENISLINNNSNGSTVKVRGGAVLNVKDGTVITGKDSYLGVECWAATVNIYDGAEIYMNGTSSYNGCLAGAGGNGTINVYGGKGLGKSGGFIAMTSGGTINVEGGEWTANTDGAYANDNKSVLVAQSDKQYNAGAGNSIVNVTGGTFKGGYNCYGNAAGDAQINISGGNFNADPATYLAQNYVAVENNGVWNVELAAAKVGETKYADLQEAIKAAAPAGTVELLNDVTVDEWIMFSETLTIGNGDIITTQINGLTINGNGKTVTIKDIESAGNGARLFYDATNLNINNLTFNFVDNAANLGGIGLTAGTINNVTFNGGGYAIFPGTGAVIIEGCTFKTNATSIYYEEERDNLVVTGNTFENPDNVNVILLRGNTTFTDNNVISGRTVNVVSGSPVVTGNNFNDVRFKVYNVATATIENNTINTLAFNDESVVNSTFDSNTLSAEAQAVLDAAEFPVAGLLGEGTETSPYLISNKKELLWFQAKVDEQAADGSTQFAGKYFKLTADIDLADENWNPIGSMIGDHGSFKGVFDGGDHTISNLKVEQAGNGIGLFARTAGNAVIKNLKLKNVSVKSTDNSNYAGAVVGNAYASTKIENVHVSGNVLVSGRGYIGGIAGHGYVVMDNVSVVATGDGQGNDKGLITSTFWCAGGILGYGGEGSTNIMNANVENVVVTSAAGGLGAIVGMAEDNEGTQPISGSNLSAKDVEIKTYIGAYGDAYANYALGYLYGGNPTSKLTGENSVENVTIATSNGVAPTPVDAVAKINDAIYFSLQAALDAAAAGTGNVTVEILADVNLTGIDWNPVTVSEPGYPLVTVEGGNHTITGLNDMLFHSTWAGNSGLIIKNLTIANSAIVNDKDDAAGTVGVGAFIGYPQASATITLENCHLVNSSVEGGHWTGGLIGMAGGYNGEDGPVFMNLTIKGCSVTGSTITGKGSVGGVIGHGSCAAWTNVVIEETTVEGNTITSTGSSNVKAGAIMGTIGAAGQPTTANGETKTGGASVSATVAGNTVTSNGTAITTIYGRQGTPTGQLYVAGGSYDKYPIEQGVAYAAPIEGYEIVENTDGTYGIQEAAPAYVAQVGDAQFETLSEAVAAAQAGQTVTLLADVETADGIVITDKNLVIDLNSKTYTTTEGASTNNRNFKIEGTSVVTIKNGTMVAAGDYSSGAYGTVRTEGSANVTLEGLKLYNYRGNGLNIKACAGTTVTVKDTEIYANYGGGIESAGGTIVVDNVTVEQKGMYTAPYNSMAISVNGGGKVTVNSGTYSTECITAEEANNQGTSHGPWVAGVLNSGGTLIINGGTFSNDNFGENSLATYARGAILADTKAKVEINGGTFNVLKNVIDIQNNLGDANNNPSVVLAGGTYSADPRESAQYGSNLITLADGYDALPDLNGNYVVGVKPTATVNNLGMTTIAAGDYSIWNGSFDQNTEDDGDMPLSFVMQFLADQDAEDMATSPYADWYGDFVITFTGIENGSFTADGCYLAGHYGSFGWVKVPVDGMTIEEGARYPVMLGVGLGQKYDYICSSVEDFKCALYLTPEILEANPNIQVKLELAVVDNSKGGEAAKSALVNNENVYSVTDYTYDAEDFVVDPNYIAELIIDDAEGEPYTNDTEKTVGKLTYVRTLPAAGIWYPVFLPFDVPVAALNAELFDVARINDFHTNFSEEDGSIEKMWVEYIVRKSGTFAAGMPFLVRAKNSNVLEMVIELEDVTLYPADKKSTITVGSVITDVTFEGVYESLDAPVSTPSTRYLAVNAAGVWDEFDGYSLNPFRVMMTLQILDEEYYISSAASLSVGARVIGEENEDGTTTIYDVEVDRENCEDLIFDLQGRRVLEPEKGCIYIKNGKKIIF